jgi:hypothetical protein
VSVAALIRSRGFWHHTGRPLGSPLGRSTNHRWPAEHSYSNPTLRFKVVSSFSVARPTPRLIVSDVGGGSVGQWSIPNAPIAFGLVPSTSVFLAEDICRGASAYGTDWCSVGLSPAGANSGSGSVCGMVSGDPTVWKFGGGLSRFGHAEPPQTLLAIMPPEGLSACGRVRIGRTIHCMAAQGHSFAPGGRARLVPRSIRSCRRRHRHRWQCALWWALLARRRLQPYQVVAWHRYRIRVRQYQDSWASKFQNPRLSNFRLH